MSNHTAKIEKNQQLGKQKSTPAWQYWYEGFSQAQTADCYWPLVASVVSLPVLSADHRNAACCIGCYQRCHSKSDGLKSTEECCAMACLCSVACLTIIWCQFCSLSWDGYSNPEEISGYAPRGSKIRNKKQSKAHPLGCCMTGCRVTQMSCRKSKNRPRKGLRWQPVV